MRLVQYFRWKEGLKRNTSQQFSLFLLGPHTESVHLASFIFQEQDKTKQLHPDLFISPIRNKLLHNDQNFINVSTGEKTDNAVKSLELLPIAVDVPDKT